MNTVILILLNSSFLFCSLLSSEPGLCMVAMHRLCGAIIITFSSTCCDGL